MSAGIEGHVRLECVVDPTGRLTDCKVMTETPPGMGFGNEALAAAKGPARLSPRQVDGAATAARVQFNIDFRLPDPVVPLPAPQP